MPNQDTQPYNSAHYEDGYKDALRHNIYSEPDAFKSDTKVFKMEYMEGYMAGQRLLKTAPELLGILSELIDLRGQINYDSVIWNEAISIINKARGVKRQFHSKLAEDGDIENFKQNKAKEY